MDVMCIKRRKAANKTVRGMHKRYARMTEVGNTVPVPCLYYEEIEDVKM